MNKLRLVQDKQNSSYLSQGQAGIQVLNPVLWMPNQEYVSCIRMIFRPKISAHLLNIIACFFDKERGGGVHSCSQHNTQFPITKLTLTKQILWKLHEIGIQHCYNLMNYCSSCHTVANFLL